MSFLIIVAASILVSGYVAGVITFWGWVNRKTNDMIWGLVTFLVMMFGVPLGLVVQFFVP